MTPSEWGHRHQKRGHRCQPIFVLHRGEPTGWGFSEWWRPWSPWSPWRWWWPQWWLPYIEDEEEKAIVASLMIMSMNIIMMICIAPIYCRLRVIFPKIGISRQVPYFRVLGEFAWRDMLFHCWVTHDIPGRWIHIFKEKKSCKFELFKL